MAMVPTNPPDGTAVVNPVLPAADSREASAPGAPGGRERIPAGLRPLFRWAPFVSSVMYVATGLTTYYTAIQTEQFDSEGKVGSLALITTLAGLAALIAQPLVGVLSDRTRSRFGSRRPWILVGALIGTVAMLTAGLSGGIAVLTIGVCFVQFGYNMLQGAFTAVLPDRVPERFRGRYSTLAGLGVLIGAVLGPVFGGIFVSVIPVGYIALAGILLLLVVVFLLAVPEADTRQKERPAFSLVAFLRGFWVNPVKHPDFAWGFLGRLFLFGAFNLSAAYQLYIAQDYVGIAAADARALVPLLSAAAVPGMIIGTVVAGPLSDRLGRRKPLVLIAGLIIFASALAPLISPTVGGLFAATMLAGLGFGAFIAVDQALMSSLLPDESAYGKDMGVLNIAAALPIVISPAVAGLVVLTFGSYAALYVAQAVIVLVGALAVVPIRSVR
jgi:MFS family permease